MKRPLRVNFVLARAGLAGGVKSNRLIAEALGRRGHDVRILFLSGPPPRPSLRTPRRLFRHGRKHWFGPPRPHHLESSTVRLIPIKNAHRIEATDAPDADISIAGFWVTRQWIETWPETKGARGYFVRGYKTFAGPREEVEATYRHPGLKLVTTSYLEDTLRERFGGDIVRIPNGVDRSQFDAPPRSKPELPSLGFLYGQASFKGPDTALAVVDRVRATFPDLAVHAFGRDPLLPDHGKRGDIEFHLQPDQALIPALYKQSSVWLVPSQRRGSACPASRPRLAAARSSPRAAAALPTTCGRA